MLTTIVFTHQIDNLGELSTEGKTEKNLWDKVNHDSETVREVEMLP